jgi:broad specificity phosphatase PhoE
MQGEVISATYDEQPLNARGRVQAEALARHLASVPFAALYSSPLRRSLDTAQPLATVKALPVEIVPDVREIMHSADAQRPDGMSAADYIQLFKEGGSRISAHMMRVGSFEGLPGVEPRAHFRGRVRDALDALAAGHPGKRIAVVAHGGVINVFAAEVLGLERDVFMAIPNTAVSRFRLLGSRRQLVALNDTCHLRELTRST